MRFLLAVAAVLMIQDQEKIEDFYKFPVGSKWTLTKTGDEKGSVEITVTKAEGETVEVESKDKGEGQAEPKIEKLNWMVEDGFLVWKQMRGEKVDFVLKILKVGSKKGDTWTFKMGPKDATFTHMGTEELKVEAGTYQTVRVQSKTEQGMLDLYLAPKVGLIKLAMAKEGGGRTIELKEFKAGK